MSRDVLIVGGGDPAEALSAHLSGRVLRVDPEPEAVDDSFIDSLAYDGERLDGLDLVVHALYPPVSRVPLPIAEMSPSQWRAACDAPLGAALRLAKSAHRHLAARRGVMVFCVPLVGSTGAAGFSALAGLGEGLRVLARSLARCWGGDGVRAHAMTLHPAMFVEAEHLGAAAAATALHSPALGRRAAPAEIATVINGLADPATSGLTGATLIMDGGAWMAG